MRKTFLSVLALTLLGGSAQAQDYGGPATDTAIDIQAFEPIAGPQGVFSVEAADGADDLSFGAGVLLHLSKDPLVLQLTEDGKQESIVEDQLVADLLVSFGLWNVLELGAALPVYIVNTGNLAGADIGGATLGDLRLRPKFTLLDSNDGPIGLGLVANVSVPTGDDTAFASSGTFGVRPGLIVDTRISKLLLAVNVATEVNDDRSFGSLKTGSSLLYGVGAQYSLTDEWLLGGELFGATPYNDLFDSNASPLEALAGVKYRTSLGLNFEIGAGRGVVPGAGAPDYRVFTGLRYAQYGGDLDGDGIADARDQCPEEPEDVDEFEDSDGCPDPDNDNDEIADYEDHCPDEPEDRDGFSDVDGCPDPDNDEDGLADNRDNCPDEPGPREEMGCPAQADPDRDRDGILDVVDRCPELPETINGIDDEDGCPDKGEQKVVIRGDQIYILDRVYFDTAKATIKPRSFGLLRQVALTLKANPHIELIEVQGHTDDRGGDEYNLELSDARAQAVRVFLQEDGVSSRRLLARGYGETEPAQEIDGLSGGRLKDARSKNRRVQFVILEQKSGRGRVSNR